jgi:hypothetical protein
VTDVGNSFEARVASLQKSGADRYDPVRFCYIVSLARRAEGKDESVRRIIEQKGLRAIEAYRHRFERARKEAKTIVDRLSSQNPDLAATAKDLYDTCDFSGIRRLQESVHCSDGIKQFSTLTQQLNNNAPLYDPDKTRLTLYERLLQQEEEVLSAVLDSQKEKTETFVGEKMELRSYRLFREMLAKQKSEHLVNDAIVNRPENPGHLNSQMLATRSLAFMRNVSPAYLNRFVAFIDTLFALEQLE